MILSNPKYEQLLKLNKDIRWCPATVTIPELTSECLISAGETTIDLYDNQKVIYNFVKDKTSCLIEGKMSFGKTVISIALHQAWQGKTLVAVHTLNMAQQFAEEFEKFAGITPTFYCNGKHELSEVTITTFTTLRKMYKEWTDFDNIIIDEADLFFSEKSIKAVYGLNATRKVGLTGTIGTTYDTCNNVPEGVLPAFYGAYIKAEFDESKNPLKAIYHQVYTKVYKEEGEIVEPYEWHKYRTLLDADLPRKLQQLQYITDNHNDEPTLVLFDRVADVEAFYNAGLRRGLTCYKNHGQLKTKEREDMLTEFKKTGGILFGQTATLNRGYNNIELIRVFILYPLRKENTIQQIIGRVMRYMEGKESFVYLWVDSGLRFQFNKQKPIIKKHFGLDVVDVNQPHP